MLQGAVGKIQLLLQGGYIISPGMGRSKSATVELLVADEPLAAGVSFDAWEIHPELFDCACDVPSVTSGGEGGEGGEGEGEEGHAEGGEGGEHRG